MRKILLSLLFALAFALPAKAQMRSLTELMRQATENINDSIWCQAKYHLLLGALHPDLPEDKLPELQQAIRYCDRMSELQKSSADSLSTSQVVCIWQPSFPGGDTLLAAFIVSHLKLPRPAEEYFNQVVTVHLVIERDGRISEATIRKGFSKEDDQACLEMIAQMPFWMPAAYDGVPVRSELNLPISLNMDRYRYLY